MYNISEEYLDKVFKERSKSLVGRCLKRLELFDDIEESKKVIKELIYEEYRELKSNILAFSCGVKFYVPKEQG